MLLCHCKSALGRVYNTSHTVVATGDIKAVAVLVVRHCGYIQAMYTVCQQCTCSVASWPILSLYTSVVLVLMLQLHGDVKSRKIFYEFVLLLWSVAHCIFSHCPYPSCDLISKLYRGRYNDLLRHHKPTVNSAITVTNQDQLNTCTSQNSIISKRFPITSYHCFVELNSYSMSSYHGDQW